MTTFRESCAQDVAYRSAQLGVDSPQMKALRAKLRTAKTDIMKEPSLWSFIYSYPFPDGIQKSNERRKEQYANTLLATLKIFAFYYRNNPSLMGIPKEKQLTTGAALQSSMSNYATVSKDKRVQALFSSTTRSIAKQRLITLLLMNPTGSINFSDLFLTLWDIETGDLARTLYRVGETYYRTETKQNLEQKEMNND